MTHILLKKAFRFSKRKDIEAPLDFIYNRSIGAWKSKVDNSLLINNKDFPAVSTKKCDVETGEDQKGQ
jgi:hypothetical protein